MYKLAGHCGNIQTVCHEPCVAAQGISPSDIEYRELHRLYLRGAPLEPSLYEDGDAAYEEIIYARVLASLPRESHNPASPGQGPERSTC